MQEGEAPGHQHGALRSQNLPGDTAVPLPGVLGGSVQVKEAPGFFGGERRAEIFQKNQKHERCQRIPRLGGSPRGSELPPVPCSPPWGAQPPAAACVGGPKTLGSQGRTLRRAAVPAPRAWSTKRALRQAQLGEELCHPVLRPCWSLGRLETGFGVNGVGFGANGVEKGQQGPGPSCVVLTGTSGRQLHVSMTKALPHPALLPWVLPLLDAAINSKRGD